jgi:preprotein translocase subunit SecA
MESKRHEIGDQIFFETIRRIALHVVDILWVEHLETMEYTRSSVNLRAYGQRDPLIEYKKEGIRLFRELEFNFKEKVVSLIETLNVKPSDDNLQVEEEKPQLILSSSDDNSNKSIKRETPKIGRNDPCYCGSGKKYKHCHGE